MTIYLQFVNLKQRFGQLGCYETILKPRKLIYHIDILMKKRRFFLSYRPKSRFFSQNRKSGGFYQGGVHITGIVFGS
jgi:hypothetical protein